MKMYVVIRHRYGNIKLVQAFHDMKAARAYAKKQNDSNKTRSFFTVQKVCDWYENANDFLYRCDKCGQVYSDIDLTKSQIDGVCGFMGCTGTLQPLPPVRVVEVTQ